MAEDYVAIFEKLYETYGRKIRLLFLHGTGLSSDATAARADAIKAAEEMHAFVVVNGNGKGNGGPDHVTAA